MTVFDLHAAALGEYRDFVRAYITIRDVRIRDFVNRQVLADDGALWPEPLVQLSPGYQPAHTLDALAAEGVLHAETARVFRRPDDQPFRLHRHQEDAIRHVHAGRSFVVTSGTGSGKSLCYFIPIADAVLRRAADAPAHTTALVVYPMNALVNSQFKALQDFKRRYEERYGRPFPLTFARYTGEVQGEAREQLRMAPPHILLTNYVMVELMMVRPEDRGLLGEGALRFVVFDELHTYRGRQGADVAMLVRRLKARFADADTRFVGTSATMVADRTSTPEQRRAAVADFARRFFGHSFAADDVIEETLQPVTGSPPAPDDVRHSLDDPPPTDAEAFRAHPVARWIEYALGVQVESDGRLRRRQPRTLADAAAELSRLAARDEPECRACLQRWLAHGAALRDRSNRPVFAFKLHQFISQGRTVEATLEPAERRAFAISGQLELKDGRLLAPLLFCRHCGQDYYAVRRVDDRVLPAAGGSEALAEEADGETARYGYLVLADMVSEGEAEPPLPDNWLDVRGRVLREYRDRLPEQVWVTPQGVISSQPQPGATRMYWLPKPFPLCLNCGEQYDRRDSEFIKLGGLATEGRSSATTVLATALLRRAQAHALHDKLLSFTDNRQDASLQAGHFNDFVQVAMLRSALYAALQQEQRIEAARIALAVQAHIRLTPRDYGNNPAIARDTEAWRAKERAFTAMLEYRLYEDLRRGWRFTRPNLEQVGLLRIEYRGLGGCCADPRWQTDNRLRALADATPERRQALLTPILDHLRRKLAISAPLLQAANQREFRRRVEDELDAFWGFEPDELLRLAQQAAFAAGSGRVGLGARSSVGRYLKRELGLDDAAYEDLIAALLDLLVEHDLLRAIREANETTYQLNHAALVWCLGDGQPMPPDPITRRRADGYAEVDRTANAYFQQLYQLGAATLIPLEAREHTAQVVTPGERERREQRFRGEHPTERPLPYLVCSPTMELGVDIADLELVHLRNVPPTPANYAQRSGRAGRQGQPGLIVAYCGAYNQHDQYFFRHRVDMVAGSVRAPRLELANEALLRSHIHAEWLAEVGLPLRDSIAETVDTDQRPALPLKENARGQIALSPARRQAVRDRVLRALRDDLDALKQAAWWSEAWLDQVIESAAEQFDRAFDRWRELYRAAWQEREAARADEDRARTREEGDAARRRQVEASRQLDLLLQRNVQFEESDFYPYRYLAVEGFLPGYNFPALPVRAWVPRLGREGEFITRPRALALTEYAPHNFVYHEGKRWKVDAFQAPPDGLHARRETFKLCCACGAMTDTHQDRCLECDTLLDGTNSEILTALEMPNVRLARSARITSDEEERQRQGYRVQAVYALEGCRQRIVAEACASDGRPLGELTYALAADLRFVNHGRRGSQHLGFLVNLSSGQLYTEGELQGEDARRRRSTRPDIAPMPDRVRLMVRVPQDVLLFRPHDPPRAPEWWLSLGYALRRGIGKAFQLEENELGFEVVGAGAWRRLLFYENAEGSLGVLAQIARSPRALAQCARNALEVCHFDPDTGQDTQPDCAKACYECLLSFDNQTHALLLDRHAVRDALLHLSRADTLHRYGERSWREQLEFLRARTDLRSELERRLLDALERHRLRLPDQAQYHVSEVGCVADFFYAPRAVVFCDGSPHDAPAQRAQDEQVRAALRKHGYTVIVLRYDRDLDAQLAEHPIVFGEMGTA